MSEFNIEVIAGKTVRLPTAGKYNPKDIVVTAIGGGGSADYDAGYEAGQIAEYERFWDNYQDNGNRRNYYYAFSYTGWNDECFNPKRPIICEGSSTNGQNVFYYNTVVTRIPVDIIVNGISARQMFYRCSALKTITKLVLNGATDFSNMFNTCSALENITVEGSIDVNFNISATDVLSADSVQSIIDHLADLTGKTTQTFTVHQTVRNAMTEEQVDTIVNKKNWTLAPAESTN